MGPKKKKTCLVGVCTLHHPRHVRMLIWLDPSRTRGIAVSKRKGTLAEEGIFGPSQRRDHHEKE